MPHNNPDLENNNLKKDRVLGLYDSCLALGVILGCLGYTNGTLSPQMTLVMFVTPVAVAGAGSVTRSLLRRTQEISVHSIHLQQSDQERHKTL